MIPANTPTPVTLQDVEAAAWRAIRAVPPAWPLDATVAVNPYLGQSGLDLASAGARVGKAYGAAVTMPGAWYAHRISSGEIDLEDLRAALDDAPVSIQSDGAEGLASAARSLLSDPAPLQTVADLAAHLTEQDWPGVLLDRLTAWAAGYFDAGQAMWRAPRASSAFASWRLNATHDLTPEILGVPGFAAFVANAPDMPVVALGRAVATLGLETDALELYFHRALATTGGWAQLARQKLWQAELGERGDDTALALLAARVLWDEALLTTGVDDLRETWEGNRQRFAEPVTPNDAQLKLATLQAAYERAAQRRLLASLTGRARPMNPARPAMQAAFCIDVRSEVFRRALESLDAGIRTLGFAGFFGLGLEHRRFASDAPERRLPVLLNPPLQTTAAPEHGPSDWQARIADRGVRAWGRFKLAAVSSFAFVEASGPFYAAKLLADALGLPWKRKRQEPAPRIADALTLDARTAAAEAVLRAMSLTADFARLVLLVGHGARVTNNPHASALQCGACGGYAGDVNARILASLLNDAAVRHALSGRGIAIPQDTRFVAGLHDTTSDQVELFVDDSLVDGHREDITRVRAWLSHAGRLARLERRSRVPGAASESALLRRGRDWAEVRPEWALAGCQAFIAAPRQLTAAADLGGRAFLHDYVWQKDDGFAVLELILTAPVVVASWISLQYYGSTVSPDVFGSGNKLLHNVVGGIGVLEGGTGPLRVGLSRQAVHDGETFVHDPVRLNVCIAAPREAISTILERHDGVRALFDNGWLSLFALDDSGRAVSRYRTGLAWGPVDASPLAPLGRAA